jgi:hypothetical protein
MPYTIDADPNGRFAIDFVDEPEFVHGFRMAPEHIEPELMAGNWLLLTFAIWSSLERPAIDTAVRVAKQFGGQFKLGVRPIEVADELAGWLPMDHSASLYEITHEVSSEGKLTVNITGGGRAPFWHWLGNGSIVAQHSGLLDSAGLMSFVEVCLSATERSRHSEGGIEGGMEQTRR